MKGSYYDETTGLALVALIGVCVLSGLVVIGLLMWGVL